MAANTERNMLPLQSLLNPASPGPSTPGLQPQNPFVAASPAESARTAASSVSAGTARTVSKRCKAGGEPQIQPKSKPRGQVRFPPFEDLGEDSLREVSKFQVTPFGKIHQGYHHIPYSSSKKDLFDKTGRESIEAFKYEFRVPGRETTYVVMWDYNIGIVRMNPFIKWGRFPKTKSSQLLDKNPGLREISPGITGGAVLAQGYWVPYRCAKALFATFCFPIAGALIPLFGPSFPSECIPPEDPNHGAVTISPALIADVAIEVGRYREYHLDRARTARSSAQDRHRSSHVDPSHYYHPDNQDAHFANQSLQPARVGRPEHFRHEVPPQQPPAHQGHHSNTGRSIYSYHNTANISHGSINSYRRYEPYHTTAVSTNRPAVGPPDSHLHSTSATCTTRPGNCDVEQPSQQQLRRKYLPSDAILLDYTPVEEQRMQITDEAKYDQGENMVSWSTSNNPDNSSQFTAAMALVMLSGDQRDQAGGGT